MCVGGRRLSKGSRIELQVYNWLACAPRCVQLHSPDHDPDPVAVNDNDGGFCLRVQVQPDSAWLPDRNTKRAAKNMAGAGAEYLASIFGTEKDKYVIFMDMIHTIWYLFNL